MADQQTLSIVITAENAQAVASLNQLRNDLAKFEKGLKNAFDSNEVLKFSKSIEDTKRKMEVLNNQVNPLSKITTGSNQAAQALTNVGRVAQDLPFGFIGIQNNLNPLLESFQRLKAETGTTGGALKALGSSLIGAGGIGLALSVASSAFLLFGDQLFATDKKAQAAKKSIDDATASIAKDAAQVEVLVQQYKNSNLSLGQRESIIKQLNNIAPEYFAGLQAETTSFEQLTKASNDYTASLTNQIKAKILGIQLEQVLTDKMKAQAEQAKVLALQQDYNIRNRTGRTDTQGDKALNDKLKGYEKEEKFLVNQIALLSKVKDASKPEKGGGASNEKLQLEDFHGKQKYADAVQIQQHLLDVQKEMLAVSQKQYEVDVKKEALIRLGKPMMDGKFAGTQNATLSGELSQKEADNKQRLLGIEQSRLDVIANLNNKFKEQKELAETIGGAFQNLFQNIANGANPFETLTNAVKQLVVDLAAAAAKMFLIKAIMTAINPAAGAARGAGGILGSLIGGITPFATGGIVSKPTLGMVGEAGTEAILPLDRFQGMLAQSFQMGSVSGGGNSQQPIILDTRIAGNDIWLSQRRTDFSRGLRTGG
jgi:hypothetical protein